jgi:hypothetical protein
LRKAEANVKELEHEHVELEAMTFTGAVLKKTKRPQYTSTGPTSLFYTIQHG